MAEGADDDEKTEEPSQKKLDDARKKGQVVLSREVSSALLLGGLAASMAFAAAPVASSVERALLPFIERPHALPLGGAGREAIVDALGAIAMALAIPLGIAVVAALLGPFVQNGFVVATERLAPKFDAISPFAGAKRLVSMQTLVEFLKSTAKVAIVGVVLATIVMAESGRLEGLVTTEIPDQLALVQRLAVRLIGATLAFMIVVAVADYTFQWLSARRRLRMTKQEVKEEYKQSEGDPHVRSRQKQIRMERSRKRMMAAVPTASVVITNPTHYAVALKYEIGANAAPVVVAKGKDRIALRIREVAAENKVPLVENPPLARALHASVDVDREIPREHYKAVAEVISYVFRLQGRLKS